MTPYAESAHVFEPKEVMHEDILGMYPMTMFANMQNTGNRLQEVANRVGFPILASDLFLQNKKTIFDMKAREANAVTGDVYREVSKRRSEFFNVYASAFDATTTIGIGDSLGVPAIQGMQLYGETDDTFDAILLRDGWNLGPATSPVRGIARYLTLQIKDALHTRKNPNEYTIPDYGYENWSEATDDETNILSKMWNVTEAMRGTENANHAMELTKLVATRGLALSVICLRNGISGTYDEQARFLNKLDMSLLANITGTKVSDKTSTSVRYRAEMVDGWHSDLMDPERAAKDIANTLNLLATT